MLILKNNLLMLSALALVLIFTWQAFASDKTVEVMDTGLNMVRETVELPSGWEMHADIVSDSMSGAYRQFKHDVIGPDDEILRELPPVYYGILTGKNFQQTWHAIIDLAIRDFMQVESIGRLIQNGPLTKRTLEALEMTPEQKASAANNIYEVTVTGKKNNRPYTASLVFANQPFGSGNGMLVGGIIGSPTNKFEATLETSFKISKQTEMNPAYDSARSRLIDQSARVSSAQHNQRMRNNQQQFNQHQQTMKNRSQMNDQQNQQWMNNFTKSTPNSGAQGYSGHDAYIDGINETSTFEDPSTGYNRTVDGQYDYNYTDGAGSYYGTDDPSFNPGMMQNGDWQETQPLQPQY